MKSFLFGQKIKLFAMVMGITISVFFTAVFLNKVNFINDVDLENSEIMAEGNIISEEEMFYLSHDVEEVEVCGSGNSKTYMNYKLIKTKSSYQYKYIKAYMSVGEKGFLVDDEGFIGVALGSYFGPIGSKFVFTLETGEKLYLVKVEAKSDMHTINGCYQYIDHSVIEFVVDIDLASEYFGVGANGYILNGNFGNVIKGDIVKIERVL